MTDLPPPLTLEEVAERWNAPPLRVLKLCKTRRLRHFKIGKGVYRIPVDAVSEYEARCVSSSIEDGGTPSRDGGATKRRALLTQDRDASTAPA